MIYLGKRWLCSSFITAKLSKVICSNVQVETQLQQLSAEQYKAQTIRKCDDTRLMTGVLMKRHYLM